MRLKLEKPIIESDCGKRRTISKFLWLPKEINYEIRWLEKALIEQVVTFRLVSNADERYSGYKLPLVKHYYWEDSKWINPPPNLK